MCGTHVSGSQQGNEFQGCELEGRGLVP
jgi:hypothetical protein